MYVLLLYIALMYHTCTIKGAVLFIGTVYVYCRYRYLLCMMYLARKRMPKNELLIDFARYLVFRDVLQNMAKLF